MYFYTSVYGNSILLTPKPQSQSEKRPSTTLNPKYQFEKTFPDTPKPEFQNEIPLSDTMKVKSQIEMSFYSERRSFLKKISYFRTGQKSERELTNYLLTPKM